MCENLTPVLAVALLILAIVWLAASCRADGGEY